MSTILHNLTCPRCGTVTDAHRCPRCGLRRGWSDGDAGDRMRALVEAIDWRVVAVGAVLLALAGALLAF